MPKKIKKIVVSEVYFNLIERKASLLDRLFDGDVVSVSVSEFKEKTQIDKAWDKAEAYDLEGSEPYQEPKTK
jgi:hypothetical protein